MLLRNLISALIVLGVSVVAEQQGYDDAAQADDAVQAYDDAAQANDDAQQAYYYDNIDYSGAFSAGDDTIQYWTDYAILPKRCIV